MATSPPSVCELFEKVSVTKKAKPKRKLVEGFFDAWKGGFFPLLRLLLPQLDKDRNTYGMKETTLGKAIVAILDISLDSADANALIHWRRPTSGGAGKDAGDFGIVAYGVLKDRTPGTPTLTVADVNARLDDLNRATDKTGRYAVLRHLVQTATALEYKWIIRIILKDLKIHSSEQTLLKYYHPNALQCVPCVCLPAFVAFFFDPRDDSFYGLISFAVPLFA